MAGEYGLRFLLTYKFSQDHIALFCGKIQSMGGCNNNPTARQFKSAYKKILTHNDIQDVVSGNCIALESVPILTATSRILNIDVETVVPSVEVLNSSGRHRRMHEDEFLLPEQDNTDYGVNEEVLSSCSEKIVAYIAGFVSFKLKESIHCEDCCSALVDVSLSPVHSLIELKSKSALTTQSLDVIDICKTSEKFFRQVAGSGTSKLDLSHVKCHKLVQSVLEYYLNKPIFSSLKYHMLETDGLDNHLVILLKAVTEKYLQVRHYYAGRQYTAKLREKVTSKSRQVLSSLVIFFRAVKLMINNHERNGEKARIKWPCIWSLMCDWLVD